uniref:Uncharacterized protein n=1 Tax=Hyaloperonospora arabidopsidis (strain Emoy2) TaxID=559515 RepID=M4B1G4_HYAAE
MPDKFQRALISSNLFQLLSHFNDRAACLSCGSGHDNPKCLSIWWLATHPSNRGPREPHIPHQIKSWEA